MGDSGEGEVTDALKYLDELDKYYSQVARPRLVTRLGGQHTSNSASHMSSDFDIELTRKFTQPIYQKGRLRGSVKMI